MRRFFVLLVMVLFVGGHGVANWLHPLHGIAVSQGSAIPLANISTAFRNNASILPSTSRCCQFGKFIASSGSLHCAADCGLSAPQLASIERDNLSLDDAVLHRSTVYPVLYEHFRPPIA